MGKTTHAMQGRWQTRGAAVWRRRPPYRALHGGLLHPQKLAIPATANVRPLGCKAACKGRATAVGHAKGSRKRTNAWAWRGEGLKLRRKGRTRRALIRNWLIQRASGI